MAAARKTPAKPTPEPDVEQTEVEAVVEPDGGEEDGDVVEPTPEPEQPEPASGDVTPPGYMWVTRRKSVQLGTTNPQWSTPSLIDVKSFAELESQGWRAADGPDADGPTAK